MDVKFLKFITEDNRKIKRFQYTAIDNATRIRVLKIYKKHTQKNAIDFVYYVIEKHSFRIHTIRTDIGHKFQSQFHWHILEQGIDHVYIKPRTPRLIGKDERSLLIDDWEFYQILEYKDDVDLCEKLEIWEDHYNFHRPHGPYKGNTLYKSLRERSAL